MKPSERIREIFIEQSTDRTYADAIVKYLDESHASPAKVEILQEAVNKMLDKYQRIRERCDKFNMRLDALDGKNPPIPHDLEACDNCQHLKYKDKKCACGFPKDHPQTAECTHAWDKYSYCTKCGVHAMTGFTRDAKQQPCEHIWNTYSLYRHCHKCGLNESLPPNPTIDLELPKKRKAWTQYFNDPDKREYWKMIGFNECYDEFMAALKKETGGQG